jgi:Programmed cell death protein 2, C-terminal putative domain
VVHVSLFDNAFISAVFFYLTVSLRWSSPSEKTSSNSGTGASRQKGASEDVDSLPLNVPLCSCGRKRVFEVQILPTLLHILEVDRYATTSETAGWEQSYQDGGMNWGNIAIFSCPAACSASDTEFVIVQASVDDDIAIDASLDALRKAQGSGEECLLVNESEALRDDDDDDSNGEVSSADGED